MTHTHHHHPHDRHHHHCHGDPATMGEKRLWWAIGANIALTVAQIIGGFISGSLSLISDAVHNLSDAVSLAIAAVAIRIGCKPADDMKTFGYKRAETVAALINLTSLVIIGVFLCYEAVNRLITPEPIAGWIVVIVAGVALIVDIYTAFLTYRQSKTSMNIRAAFLHNLADAFASIGVMIAGTLILLYGWVWVDAVMTLVIAGYILWHGIAEMPHVIHLLMEGTPRHLSPATIANAMQSLDGVSDIHHMHIWQPDEQRIALECHVVLEPDAVMDDVKLALKSLLHDQFGITHSTLEFENAHCGHNQNTFA